MATRKVGRVRKVVSFVNPTPATGLKKGYHQYPPGNKKLPQAFGKQKDTNLSKGSSATPNC